LFTFTCHQIETRKITRLFKDTNIEIALQAEDAIQNILKPCTEIDKYDKSGMYHM
jgi:hypothetical protein